MMIEQGRYESMQETADAIAQLSTAMASDRSTVATLTTTNTKLVTQLEAAHALIAKLKREIATLKIKLKPVWQGQRPARTTNNDSYCRSRGYLVGKSHTSASCQVRKTGHQEAATKTNNM
jgi:predicted RNase H-like nuclease (RuvC/YqgF family)